MIITTTPTDVGVACMAGAELLIRRAETTPSSEACIARLREAQTLCEVASEAFRTAAHAALNARPDLLSLARAARTLRGRASRLIIEEEAANNDD